jgi:hypothetical protein
MKLAYILSQPRSGSTVLSAMLDKRRGIVCMPESSFPQVLGAVSDKERSDSRWLAAMYIGSTFPSKPRPPTPLTLDEAESCMVGDNEEILGKLGGALAGKIGRKPDEVTTVVWKTTRTIGLHRGPLITPGRFIVLRRNLHNVYESQFRVDFGIRNRNPYRYAIFAHSYEHAFARLPKERTFKLDYETIPHQLPALIDFIGMEDRGEWDSGQSSLELVTKNASWLTEATKEFNSTDAEKRARLDTNQVSSLNKAWSLTRPVRPFLGPLRRHFDLRSMNDIRDVARDILASEGP